MHFAFVLLKGAFQSIWQTNQGETLWIFDFEKSGQKQKTRQIWFACFSGRDKLLGVIFADGKGKTWQVLFCLERIKKKAQRVEYLVKLTSRLLPGFPKTFFKALKTKIGLFLQAFNVNQVNQIPKWAEYTVNICLFLDCPQLRGPYSQFSSKQMLSFNYAPKVCCRLKYKQFMSTEELILQSDLLDSSIHPQVKRKMICTCHQKHTAQPLQYHELFFKIYIKLA